MSCDITGEEEEEPFDAYKSQLVMQGVRFGPEHPTLPENIEQLKSDGVTGVTLMGSLAWPRL